MGFSCSETKISVSCVGVDFFKSENVEAFSFKVFQSASKMFAGVTSHFFRVFSSHWKRVIPQH